MPFQYNKKVMQHFMHPKNVGKIKNADGIGKVKSPICGDSMNLYIKVKNNKIKDIKFQTFGCLPANIEILAKEGEWMKIQSIRKGDDVLNSNGNKTKVVKTYVRRYNGQMITIVPFISAFNKISTTPEHPVLCIKRKWLKSARKSSNKCKWLRINKKELISIKPDFIKAKDLEIADYLVFVPNKKVNNNGTFTKDMMKLLGYYLSEGYAMSNNVLAFALNKNEKKNIFELKSLIFKITEKKAKERIRKNVAEIYICSKKWADFFVAIGGKYAIHKKLADNILTLPFKKQWQMIETHIKGDGNIYKRRAKDSPTYRITTASKSLAVQIQEILARGGIFASIKKDLRPRDHIEGRKISSNPLYELSFKLQKKHHFAHINRKHLLIPIKRIEKEHYTGKVYNFQVIEEPHSYLVRGFAVHNCAAAIASSSVLTQMVKDKTIEQAEKITRNKIVNALGSLPKRKIHCSVLAAKALHAAIKDYKKKCKRK